MQFDYVIVGAGWSGAVIAERMAKVHNKKVLLVERNNHVGGHCHDHYDKHGILIHTYGPHIFHTQNSKVWQYVNQFSDFRIYHHEVLGMMEGKLVPIPFNINALYMVFPDSLARRLEEKLVEKYGFNKKVPILKLREEKEADLQMLAEYIYENIFLNYTLKQWELKPDELSPAVSGRVPVYVSKDNRYFQDPYQGMPTRGYTVLFENLLDHDNIKIMLNTDYKEILKEVKWKEKLVYSGPIDYYYDYKFGELQYRTIDFVNENFLGDPQQPVGTVNYPNNYDFTRITDYRILTGQKADTTTTMKEFSRQCVIGKDIPYYPMFTDEWLAKYKIYEDEAAKEKDVVFIGRLAQYKYFNMDQTVANALVKFEQMEKDLKK